MGTYRILDQQNRIKLESTLAICQAWIKHYRAEFHCRIVPVEQATTSKGMWLITKV